jgi:enamine deaminase RidA (YjgF/YER057c/UK114 family)
VATAGGTTVYVSGQLGVDAQGRLVAPGDLRTQTEHTFRNLECALAAAGATMADVVKLTTFVVNLTPEAVHIIREARKPFLPAAHPPASTLVGVTALVAPEYLIEIEAIAVVASAVESKE